jgi:predicted DNA-binding ribbon-helix-helix protein
MKRYLVGSGFREGIAQKIVRKPENLSVVRRAIIMRGRRSSISIEDEFLFALKAIAASRGMGLGELLSAIKSGRTAGSLSSAVRLFVLQHYREEFASRKSAKSPRPLH